jgi:hypothetical protein
MTTRTFKQRGRAYGPAPVNVVTKINGVDVFNGAISALNIPPTSIIFPDDFSTVKDLFTWTADVDFDGTVEMEVSVTDGELLLTETVANYATIIDDANPPPGISSGADGFGKFYFPADGDESKIADPMSNVMIDGVSQSVVRKEGQTGQCYWLIPAGVTFTCTLTIKSGFEGE